MVVRPRTCQCQIVPIYNLKRMKEMLPRASVSEHFAQTLLLVGPQHGRGLQVDVDVRVHAVVAEIVLRQQWVLQFDAALLYHL